jgi:AraC-like DNA-binding protein
LNLFLGRIEKRPKFFPKENSKLDLSTIAYDIWNLWLTKPKYWQDAIILDIKRILTEILNQHKILYISSHNYTDLKKIEPAINMAYQKIPQKVSIKKVCDETKLSKQRFNELFNKTMGINYSQFLMNARLHMVMRDLLLSNDKILVVANRWGFYDNSHFTKTFIKFFNMSPKEYRDKFINN